MLSYQVGTTFLLGDHIPSHSHASQEESPAVTAREWEMSTELLLAQLILLFVLDTQWHSPPQIPEPASHLFALRTRRGSAFLPAHTPGAALLTKQPSVLLLRLRCFESHGFHPNLDNFFLSKLTFFALLEKSDIKFSSLLLLSHPYCQFGNQNTQSWAPLGPTRATWLRGSACTEQPARAVPQFVMLW